MPKALDVIVVGSGIVGLSNDFQLNQPGGVRQQWGTRANCVLARESMQFYAQARERLGMRVDPGFRACGYLFLAHSQRALEQLRVNRTS